MRREVTLHFSLLLSSVLIRLTSNFNDAMILSMTGFGKASSIYNNTLFEVTIRTLNAKQLEIATRLPLRFREFETDYRNLLTASIQRGRIDYTLTTTPIAENSEEEVDNYFDEKRLYGYFTAYSHFCKRYQIDPLDKTLTRFLTLPGILKPISDIIEAPSQQEQDAILTATHQALQQLDEFRLQEGKMLALTFTKCLDTIEEKRLQVAQLAPQRIEVIQTKLKDLLEELSPSIEVDKGRLEQELIYYIEKLDINEELTRLDNHIKYFLKTISGENIECTIGKKLGFIAQEMGREINTIGSKSNDHKMQHLVVEMKDALEQIKEQVANVL